MVSEDNHEEKIDMIEDKLASLSLKIPELLKTPPHVETPATWVRVRGDKAYISGHGPQNPDGSLAGPFGKVGSEVSLEQAYESAKLAGL